MAQAVGATVAAPDPIQLDPPKSTPFTPAELAAYDGTSDKGIYVAIKGEIFDGT